MPSPNDRTTRLTRRLGAVGILVAVLGASLPAFAEVNQSDYVLIRNDDVVGEDLYTAGNRIQIDGVIHGDLDAVAFGEVQINGRVDGSVTVLASRVVVTGTIGGSLRAAAREVVVEGTVEGDVLTAVWGYSSAAGSQVGRDLIPVAWRAGVEGTVGRDVVGTVREMNLGAEVGGNVDISVRHLSVSDSAKVAGNLAYRSGRPADIAGAASIEGSVLDRRPLEPNVRVRGLGILFRVLLVIFGAGLGLGMVWAVADRSKRAATKVRTRPLAVVGRGLALLTAPILVVLIVFMIGSLMQPSASIPLLLIALPIVFALVGAVMLMALIAPVPPAVWVGTLIAGTRSVYAQFVVGFLALVVATSIPVVGPFALVAMLVLGIGGWATSGEKA
jgi:cytoskeletal protein CcmA (bactofilin family)